MSQFKYVGRHATTLGNGRPLAPGDKVDLNAEAQKDTVNAGLIAGQQLVSIPPRAKPRAAAKEEGK